MAHSNIRTTIKLRPEVALWLDHEKADRQHGSGPEELVLNGERVTRDLIVCQSVTLLSHVQNPQTMEKIFGKDAPKVRTRLLQFLSSNRDPSK